MSLAGGGRVSSGGATSPGGTALTVSRGGTCGQQAKYITHRQICRETY